MVAVREEALALTAAVTVIVPLFEPEAGETDSHVGELLLTVQFVLEMIVNDCCWPVDGKLIEVVDKLMVGDVPTCVTFIV